MNYKTIKRGGEFSLPLKSKKTVKSVFYELSGLPIHDRESEKTLLRSVELKGHATLFAGSGLRGDYPT